MLVHPSSRISIDQMEPHFSVASNAFVQVYANLQDDSISRPYLLDIAFEKDKFHLKLRAQARLWSSLRKTIVYLFLDASHVESLVVCDEVAPPDIANTLIKQGRCTTTSEITCLQILLKQHGTILAPRATLQKKPAIREDMEALMRLSRCKTFKIYMPSDSIDKEKLLGLCNALANSSVRPASDVVKTLHEGKGSNIVTNVDDLWTLGPVEGPPSYDAATAAGASAHESSGHSDTEPSRGLRAPGKRQMSPEPRQTPTKRHALTEKVAPVTWEAVIAAQAAQLARLNEQVTAQAVQMAAYNTQLVALREEMQHSRRPPMVDAGSQTEPAVPVSEHHSSSATPVSQQHSSPAFFPNSASQASTIENSIEDRLIMLEDGLIDEQRIRRSLNEKIDNNDERIKRTLDVECSGLEHAVTELESRVEDIENDFRDDLRQELSLELQTKLEEFIEFRLEDVEEVVKHDVRMAMENASYNFKMDLGWVE
ncbi:hypothetical protein D6D01_03469 [Aureobasidium pullulans]|uniref:Uncharacterized protein n=1 Tax=Aureobasidium pullulans TaxID=5580 RepID=A0A4S9LK08_AURPU|nr:hypothetical protein D6D01_03469 [Aureobasidium pullulans]